MYQIKFVQDKSTILSPEMAHPHFIWGNLIILGHFLLFDWSWSKFSQATLPIGSLNSWDMISFMITIGSLKLVSAIFYQISPLKTMKNVFYFIWKSLFVLEIFNFLYFFLPLQVQKDKSKWNNLWCHELTCINLQM